MNQIYRALHMPKGRLLKKLAGWEEIYTIGWRDYTPGKTLPEGGDAPFATLPSDRDFWYADPLLFSAQGQTVLFCEAYDRRTHKGHLAVAEFLPDGSLSRPRIILSEAFHLSFPNVFCWRGEIYMLPETGADHSLRLYRCTRFPDQWALAARLDVGAQELCDTVILSAESDKLELLSTETLPTDQLQVRWQRFTLLAGEAFGENPQSESDGTGGCTLLPHTAFNEEQQFNYCDRSAGPLFSVAGKQYRPVQLSTDVDYGVSLQFWQHDAVTGSANYSGEEFFLQETAGRVVMPEDVDFPAVPPAARIGVHTYCHDETHEIIDLRYLEYNPKKWLNKLRSH